MPAPAPLRWGRCCPAACGGARSSRGISGWCAARAGAVGAWRVLRRGSGHMTEGERYHSLDAVRAGALLLGIVLHAAMTFIAGFHDMGFPIVDQMGTSTTMEIVFFVLHIFRMALFFLVAGFFARLVYRRGGLRGFIRNRLRRIALPLLIFYPLVLPLVFIPVIWAGKQLAASGVHMPPAPPLGFPWGHLWFLYLLLWLYAL